MLRIATGTPGGRVLLDHEARLVGSSISSLSDSQACASRRVVDVAPHVGEVGPLAEALGGRLEHDVPAELRPAASACSRWRPARSHRSMPYAASSSVSSSSVEVDVPSGRRASSLVDDRLAAGGSTSPGLGRRPSGCATTRRTRRPGERADRRLDGGVRRHRAAARRRAGDVGHPEQLGHALGAEERRDQRLVGLLADRGEHVGDLLAGHVERRDVDRDHRVDVGVVDRRVERVLEVLGVASAPSADRLVDDQPDRGGRVGGEQAERVGVADDRDPAPARQRLVGEQLGDVEHLVEVSTWITPAWRNIASTAAWGAAIVRTAWPIGTPWVVRPDRTAMIGLRSETRRAIRENLRGLPIDSR
jgi:hypothetical protein